MSLPFLRPSGLPRPSTIRQFLKISSVRSYSAPTTPGTTPLSTAKTSVTSSPSASPADSLKPSKPYRVLLSPSNQYPVYQISKRGGNMHLTKIKNIQGDIQALRNDLQEFLREPGGEKGEVTVRNITGQIVVKVRYKFQQFWVRSRRTQEDEEPAKCQVLWTLGFCFGCVMVFCIYYILQAPPKKHKTRDRNLFDT
jgi:large subunit ribosomal protein L49